MGGSTRRSLIALGLLVVGFGSSGCTFSRLVEISSDPAGARVWLGRESRGHTPALVRARATGPIPRFTHEPEYVTIELPGYRREVRALEYEWSLRNVVLSIPVVLGVPGIVLWGKVPTDLHVVLEAEAPRPP